MLLPSVNASLDKYPNFNPDYIKKHKIKTILFDIIDKKDMQIAVDKGLMHYYEFNKNGQLTRFFYTVIAKTVTQEYHTAPVYRKRKKISNGGVYYKNEYIYDTISTKFYYDDKNRLILTRYNDGAYYEATYFEYDSDSNITKILRTKETNISNDKNIFQLGMQTILSDERFKYEKTSSNQIKKLCLNDEGRVFKEIITNYNDSRQPLSFNEVFTATWINQETKLVYNDKKKLIEKYYISNTGDLLETKSTFEYDKEENILTEKQYRNNILRNELSYLFDEPDQKVKSFLDRDHINKTIRITKVFYTFW